MVKIPTPVPESVVNSVRGVFSGGIINILWKLFVVVLLVVAAYLLALLGFFGAAIAGMLLASLISDDVRAFVSDLWNRNFWVWRT